MKNTWTYIPLTASHRWSHLNWARDLLTRDRNNGVLCYLPLSPNLAYRQILARITDLKDYVELDIRPEVSANWTHTEAGILWFGTKLLSKAEIISTSFFVVLLLTVQSWHLAQHFHPLFAALGLILFLWRIMRSAQRSHCHAIVRIWKLYHIIFIIRNLLEGPSSGRVRHESHWTCMGHDKKVFTITPWPSSESFQAVTFFCEWAKITQIISDDLILGKIDSVIYVTSRGNRISY